MYASQKILDLSESATLALNKKVREMKEAGRDVLGLTLGEPDFSTPAHICDAAKQAMDEGFTHYPPVAGIPELRKAIVEKFRKDNGVTYKPENIVVSTGAKQSLYNAVVSLLNPGDEVIVPTPFWVSYSAMIYLADAVPVYIPTGISQDYKLLPEQLEAAITPKTRMLMINSPSNPSGSMYSREEMAALVAVLARYPDIYIIADEIYEHLAYEQTHVAFASFSEIYDRVITVNGFSKAFAMTGWRLGYIAANKEVAELCEKIQGQITSGANSIAQKAGVAALQGDMAPVFAMRDAFRRRRDTLYEALRSIPGLEVKLPPGAFYFYPDFHRFFGKRNPDGVVIEDIEALCLHLIESVGLVLVPGTSFGTAEHARLSYAYSEQMLHDAAQRLTRGLAMLH